MTSASLPVSSKEAFMFRKIYVPVDNSDYSNRAIDLAVELGRAFGSPS